MEEAWQGQQVEISFLAILLPIIPWVLIIVVVWVMLYGVFRKNTRQVDRAMDINETILELEKQNSQQLEKVLSVLEEIRDLLKRQGPA